MSLVDLAYDTALRACFEATELILPLWRNPSNPLADGYALETIDKAGVGNYATVADLTSEKRIIEVVQSVPELSGHTIVSEESDEIEGDEEWRWIIDPIDGTPNFRNGNADFGICIAVFRGETPIVGVIAMPALHQLVAQKLGTSARLLTYDGKEIADLGVLAKRYSDPLENALVGYDLGYENRAGQLRVITEKLIGKVGYASCLASFSTGNFRLLQGMMGVYFGMSPTVMDVAPAAALIPSVGGVVTDIEGKAIDWSTDKRSFIGAINPRIHEEFLAALHS
jgi:myo-inositol-1(or 4)-monophosphatase